MEWEDLGELLCFGSLALGGIYLKNKYARDLEKAQLKNKAFINPERFLNSVSDIIGSYDKEVKELMSGQFKKLAMHDHEKTIVYEVMVSDRLMTPEPIHISYSYPALATVRC